MIDILQLYKSKEIFEKSTYTPENRKQFENWQPKMVSSIGYVENQQLVLPLEFRKQPDLQQADLIILLDSEGFNPFLTEKCLEKQGLSESALQARSYFFAATHQPIIGLQQSNTLKAFEIFKIRRLAAGHYELFLDYEANSLNIGVPQRENHKIGELKPHKALRYRINGKSDFTLSGRKERSFYEYDYLMEFVGQVEQIRFEPLNKCQHEKNLPLENYKLVDERKMLR